MALNAEKIRQALMGVELPDGGDPVTAGLVKALWVESGIVRFVLEADSPESARNLESVREECVRTVRAMPGVHDVSVVLTAHANAAPQQGVSQARQASGEAPGLKIGRHPTAQEGPRQVSGVDRIVAVASGKGGVGKSTVATNLAVALARQGRKVGLLDADIYGPSVPRMMGLSGKPDSKDGKTIEPPRAHGVTVMSIGLLVEDDQAVVWRGPMLMGAMQQMLGQVNWGELDVLIIDLPPGTGDVQLSLAQRTRLTGALVVSTPQDVALLDARKAIDMFRRLGTPVLGLIENMSSFFCPHCGGESHIFGHGGVRADAERLGLPFLGELPLALDVRLAGDAGTPIAAGEGPEAEAYARLARGLVAGGVA
ncbi:P-loop NTPase [Psychromarinibacter sp. S121]|uniref:Mrp/NBP35 family ATP-binding protein n=1 Tax=Psychromarinibacter sp. S121 TaxID=3415127 RepID=UPI003C79ECD5